MGFESLLDHKCNIFHALKSDASPGYGLKGSPSFSYSKTPDLADISCHFHVGQSGGTHVNQKEPMNELSGELKVDFLINTDIRLGDKIVWLDNGLEFTAELPRPIRNHHIIVTVSRRREQKPL